MTCYINTRVYMITDFLLSSCDVKGSFSPPMAPSSVVCLGRTTKQGNENFTRSYDIETLIHAYFILTLEVGWLHLDML